MKPTENIAPYGQDSTNIIYNLLFCDDIDLFKKHSEGLDSYPFDILFDESSSVEDLHRVANDPQSNPRVKMMAYNRLLEAGQEPQKRELLGVIIEVGMDEGLDTLAAFNDGTARYINYTEAMVIWESPNQDSNALITNLLSNSINIVNQIGPWGQPRIAHPTAGNVKLSFLVSDGLYFGMGPVNVLFGDPMAAPALSAATSLMQYLTSIKQ